MSLPSAATKANLDNGAVDTPAAGRQDIEDLLDKFNTLLTHLGLSPLISPATPLGIGNGLESTGGSLAVKLDGTKLLLGASGLSLNVNAVDLAQLAHQAGLGLLYYDASGAPAFLSAEGEGEKVLKVSDGSPNTFEFAAASSGGWQFIGAKTASGDVDFVGGTDYTTASYGAFLFKLNDLQASAGSQIVRCQVKLATSGWTIDDAAASPFRYGGQEKGAGFGAEASNHIPLSGGNSVSSTAGEGVFGSVEVLGVGGQASGRSNGFRCQTAYRESGGTQAGMGIYGAMRADVTIEQIVGFRFDLDSSTLNGDIEMWGQAFPAS